jgi:hypothetical protein
MNATNRRSERFELSGLKRMRLKLIIRIAVLGLLTLVMSSTSAAQEKKQMQKPRAEQPGFDPSKGTKPPSGPSFYIGAVEGAKGMYSILLADGGGKTVAGTFTLQQLDIFEAVLEAAMAFALSDEKVGSGTPITTRLMDQHEWSLFVDVSKIGNQSRFYVSLITPQGRLTAEAGEVIRGSKKEPTGLFVTILSQVQSAKASSNGL